MSGIEFTTTFIASEILPNVSVWEKNGKNELNCNFLHFRMVLEEFANDEKWRASNSTYPIKISSSSVAYKWVKLILINKNT